MNFVGELAVDLCGVSRDVMTAFWLEAYDRLFDDSTLYVPTVAPHVDLSVQPVLGKILSHGYLCTGFLPVQISLPTLTAVLLGPGVVVEPQILKESFLDYLSEVDRNIICRAVQYSQTNKFPPKILEDLMTALSPFGVKNSQHPILCCKLLRTLPGLFSSQIRCLLFVH